MEIHREIVALIDGGGDFAVAVVLAAEGSTPQKIGAKAIVEASGRIHGTLGGGMVEAEVQRRGVEACRSGSAEVFDFRLDHASAGNAGAICGGTMRILIDPGAAEDRAAYAAAAEALRQRRRGALLSRVSIAARTEVAAEWFPEDALPPEDHFPGGAAVRSCLDREIPRLLLQQGQRPGESVEVLAEPLIPRPLLLVAGGGHVGQALARQALLIGFEVTVVDDRPEFTDPALFPETVSTRCGNIAQEIAAFPVAGDTYVVIVTRGHSQDAEALAACIHRPAAYVGMIGSRRKVALMREDFIRSGRATREEFDRVFAPIGLDIGAVSVPEIAGSIAAELIAVRRGRLSAGHARDRVPR
jgi:xanthine dehydrogenase accessory factor